MLRLARSAFVFVQYPQPGDRCVCFESGEEEEPGVGGARKACRLTPDPSHRGTSLSQLLPSGGGVEEHRPAGSATALSASLINNGH